MALHLIEVTIDGAHREAADAALDAVADAATATGTELLEANVTGDHARAFVVLVSDDRDAAVAAARATGLRFTGPDEVRLVGATIDAVRASRDAASARYLVEWDFPADLTMDGYLARKQEKTPLYEQVPEVSFLRTYVREDMQKCLCLYDAPGEQEVRRAREVVSTPITRLHALDGDAR
ncbi:DUF4242 domain-containing protein [Conexibacter sp. CPCC 206217]|uniref:DUF4242 domain-containing protein n=1 Tax=Conexibacter sp. CPCC 206217 TaxID=3064574 RepID=UPI0027171F00|nr:DUF4242 domain-containing protein [Conexibacter sp. CPCC 206217]MDO8212359.1 DUF4242 domain-containing protein [Conexibacter sp. CPCC 206217]